MEIYYDGEWGTICDNDFGPAEANVACRQMGYEYALEYTRVSEILIDHIVHLSAQIDTFTS